MMIYRLLLFSLLLSGCTHRICDDNDPCTDDVWLWGSCTYPPAINCDDNNSCTEDICLNGQCNNMPKDCNDANACTTDTCIGTCHFSIIPNCTSPFADCTDDGDPCTDHTMINGQPHCNYPLPCDDGNACTDDICVLACEHRPIDCQDEWSCTVEQCLNGVCHYEDTCINKK